MTGVENMDWWWEAGFIAQDVLNINEVKWVVTDGDYKNKNGNNVRRSYKLNYDSLFTYATAAIKELDVKNTILETKVQQLESKVRQNETSIMSMKITLHKLLAAAN